ncbi:MAG: 6-phosphogluconolactonase [Candidatus Eisenbacteria bacterium]|nr:6-phosphogluconolactonase [Candidatus Eisenbacteria bacterium]MCC7141318.1 6-phosphogluconolactonase [Candidatus Eisenbacteria bacterium]
MKPHIHICADAEAIAREAAIEFARIAREAVIQHGFFTVALAGGSTPRRLYELIAERAQGRAGVPWESVHFFFGDERPVPPDHVDSNFNLANQALFSRIPVPAANLHRIHGEMPDLEVAAQLYETDLRGFFLARLALRGTLPRFDLVLLGMGADGHTASLFPGGNAVWEQQRWCVSGWVEKLHQHRVTLTPPVLNAADNVLFLVAGEEKAESLEEVILGENDPGRLPAQIVRPKEGRIAWLIDESAARRLAR